MFLFHQMKHTQTMREKVLKFTMYLFIIGLLISIVSLFFGQNRLTWLQFINATSLVGLFYIAIGGFMYVYFGGFFRGLSYSFQNFFKSKGDIYAEELAKNMDEYDRPNQKKKLPERLNYGMARKRPPITWGFIINALIFFVGSLILAYLLY
jgi:hypothetical protein